MKSGKKTTLAILAVFVTVGALWWTNGAVTPKQATWNDVVAEAQNGGYRLISTDEVWKLYRHDRERLLLVDTRQEWEYRAGHIEGAINFPMEPTWLARMQKKGDLARLLGEQKERPMIFY